MTAHGPFTITIDRARLLIRLTLRGLWDLPTVDRYVAAARDAFATVQAAPDAIRILIDLRQQGVQPREVAERIQAAVSDGLSRGSRHAVLVSASMVHRLQAQRVGTALHASFFTEEAAALAWLFDPSSQAHPES